MSRREQIKMSAEEAASFLAQERTVVCATIGPRGWPHVMPLWYVLRPATPAQRAPIGEGGAPAGEPEPVGGIDSATADGECGPRLWSWTYAASQKVRNLERDARATLQVEAGELYGELRGVVLECEVVVHRDLETVARLGAAILLRNSVPRGVEPPAELPPEADGAVSAQASKRVGLEFVERRRATWDHRKLGGVY